MDEFLIDPNKGLFHDGNDKSNSLFVNFIMGFKSDMKALVEDGRNSMVLTSPFFFSLVYSLCMRDPLCPFFYIEALESRF